MLFPPTSVVDDVWAAVAHATANNELGIAAKVEPAPAVRTSDDGHGVHHSSSVSIKDELSDEDENVGRSASQRQPADRRNDPARLVAVYTADFSDVADVARVLRGLRDLGLVRPGKGLGREIYYKTGKSSIERRFSNLSTCPSVAPQELELLPAGAHGRIPYPSKELVCENEMDVNKRR